MALAYLLIAWVTFLIVSPFPTDLTETAEDLFYTADPSIPETTSDPGRWLASDATLLLDGTDNALTAVPLSDVEALGYEYMDPNEYNDADGNDMYASSILNEPVDLAWPKDDSLVGLNPPDCSATVGKRNTAFDATLGIISTSDFGTAEAKFSAADAEPQICRPPKSPEPSNSIKPILPPIAPQWKCDEGLQPYCCAGTLQENAGEAMGCTPCTKFPLSVGFQVSSDDQNLATLRERWC